MKKCPYCAEVIQNDAVICRYCGRDVPTVAQSAQVIEVSKPTNSGFSIASLILGILSLGAWFFPICGFPVAITGLVLGILGHKSASKGMATAGIVMSIIGLVASIVNAAIGAYMGATGMF